MLAVLRHEIRIYFHSFTAYIFGGVLLLAVGLGAMLYNLDAAVSNFEYVLDIGSIAFVVVVPVLTMRVIAEERKQKTDQLLYSLPISSAEVILGKYFVLLVVFAIPLLIVCAYPLIFAQYGEVYLPTSYGSLAAFFVMGAALIAIGVFISSLTDNQGFAAGIGIAMILLNYFSVSLSEYVSASSVGTAVTLFVISIAIGLLVWYLTKNENLGYIIGFIGMGATCLSFWFAPELLEGILPDIMSELSLYQRFYSFINGVFDLNAIVYYISVIVFFLFLSVQSLEKRRYN